MAINGTHAASSNYVTTAASPFLQPGRTLTVMCWANPNVITPNGNYYTVFGTATVSNGSGWGVSLRGISGAAAWEAFFTANGSSYDDYRFTSTATTGVWDHVAWVLRSDGTEAGYLNGVGETLSSFANSGAVPPETSRGLQILYGDVGGNGSFGGSLAFVRIFDGELGPGEIAAEMASKRACNRRLPTLFDMPDPYAGVDYGPLRLHVATVTGTVTWAPDPPLPEPIPAQLSRFRTLGTSGGGPTPIDLADTASAADTLTATATAPLADTAASTQALTANTTVSLNDTAAAADSMSVTATAPLADAGAATQSITVDSAVPLADAASAAQALAVAAAALLADTATGAETLTATVTAPLADTATAAEAFTATATTTLTDAGTATQTLTANATAPLADSGAGADALAAGIAAAAADTGAAADTVTVAVAVPLADSSTASATLTATAAATVGDAATSAEAFNVTATTALGDTATAADTLTHFTAVTLTDTAAAGDSLALSVLAVLADGAVGADGFTTDGGPAAAVIPATYTRSHLLGSRSRPGVARAYTHPTGV